MSGSEKSVLARARERNFSATRRSHALIKIRTHPYIHYNTICTCNYVTIMVVGLRTSEVLMRKFPLVGGRVRASTVFGNPC